MSKQSKGNTFRYLIVCDGIVIAQAQDIRRGHNYITGRSEIGRVELGEDRQQIAKMMHCSVIFRQKAI